MNREHLFIFKRLGIHHHLTVLLVFNVFTLSCKAQITSNIEEQLETITEQTQVEYIEDDSWIEQLAYDALHPIDLNHTSKAELQELHLLTDLQIFNLINYQEKNGSLLVIYELQVIEGFDISTIEKILPYVTVREHFTFTAIHPQQLISKGNHNIVLRYAQVLEKQKGFRPMDSSDLLKHPNQHYVGSPQKLYARYRFTGVKSISWGFTAEKDQGELLFVNNGFDFYSAHLFIKQVKQLEVLAIGDYQITFGQGLTAWSGLSFSTSTDIGSAKKTASGIQPYSSVDENRFMRGIATTIKFKKVKLTGFYSHKAIDAHLSDSIVDGKPIVSSLPLTGNHSTISEITDKHTVQESVYGGHVEYSHQRLTIGCSFIDDQVHAILQPARLSATKDVRSNHTLTMGMDYTCILHNVNVFGEVAHGNNKGIACVNGLVASLDPRLSITILHRFYKGNYQNNWNAALAESSGSSKKGLFIGTLINLTPVLNLSSYLDRFEFPWLKYQVDAPSIGSEFCAQLNYMRSKKYNMSIQYRQRNKEKNTNILTPLKFIEPVNQSNYRVTLSYKVLPSIELKNRFELLYIKQNTAVHSGCLLYQDIVYHPSGKKISATVRYALFQTDNFDSRIYAYENDVPGSYSIPAYYDCGMRFYLLLNYSFCKHVECWLRYAQTFYDNKQIISENSLSEINGNTKSEIKVQLKFTF